MILFLILIVIILIFLMVSGAILIRLKQMEKIDNSDENIPVRKVRLLSETELIFYHVLKSVMPNGKEISCKCRLEDIMNVENCPKKQTYRGTIKCRHVDFVIFDLASGYPDYAIELDDRSHYQIERQQTDRLKDRLFSWAGIPLIRIRAKRFYQPEEIVKIIEDNL